MKWNEVVNVSLVEVYILTLSSTLPSSIELTHKMERLVN